VLGVFLAAPTIASLREILGYLYRKVLNIEPFPQEEPPAAQGEPPRPPGTWRERLPYWMRKQQQTTLPVANVVSEATPVASTPRRATRSKSTSSRRRKR